MENKNLPEVQEVKSISGRFANMVMSEFNSMVEGGITFDEKKKRLTQHLFIKADTALKDLEAKRSNQNPPIIWQNVNLQKMALDATHRIEIGIDALIGNHLHIIPYFNKTSGKYDLDLRIGYAGKDYYKREFSYEKPLDIRYELVCETDTLAVIKKDASNDIESYNFQIKEPFNRGKVVGGFGYIIFEDPKKNKIVLVSESSFLNSKGRAQSDKFWKSDPDQMRWKTLITRVTDKLMIDPDKVSRSYFHVEQQELEADGTKELMIPANTTTNDSKSIKDRFKEQPEEQQPKSDQPEDQTPSQKLAEIVADPANKAAITTLFSHQSCQYTQADLYTTNDGNAEEVIKAILQVKSFDPSNTAYVDHF